MNRTRLKRYLSFIYILLFLILSLLFFVNDFGLADLRKTSVIIGVGLDKEEEGYSLTAQLAVPQPAENGENTKFNVVTGKGATLAAALNEVNVKTGFYPKLFFCKLIVVGESCFGEDLKVVLDYFYRNEYTGLTLNVASCKGSAGDLLSWDFSCGSSATDVIDRMLSSEAVASGNISAVTLKDVGANLFSKSSYAFMPFIVNQKMQQEGGEGGGQGGQGEQGGGQGGGGQSGAQGGGAKQCEESDLTSNQTAIFANGIFKTVLTKNETFALNLIKNDVRHAFMECGEEGDKHVLGLRNCDGGAELEIKQGEPTVNVSFKATVRIQDGDEGFSTKRPGKISDGILKSGEEKLAQSFGSLLDTLKRYGVDALDLRSSLYKNKHSDYEKFAGSLLDKAQLSCKIKLKAAN